MLVKNVRKMTVLPNQRMHASSRKRIKKLIRKSSTLGGTEPRRATDAAVGCRPKTRRVGCATVTLPPIGSIHERHRRDQGRLDLANDPAAYSTCSRHVEMRTGPEDLGRRAR